MVQTSACRFSVNPFCRPKAFTLVELLVVIGIIAVLAAIAFPVFGKMQNRGRTVQAVSDMRSIKTAIASYYTDYGKYPATDGQIGNAQPHGDTPGDDSLFGDPGGYYSSADLFNVLRAQPSRYNVDNELNPNQIVYWAGPFAKSTTAPRGGITTQDFMDGSDTVPKGSLVDPWGNQYVVWFNVSKSGDLRKAVSWFYYSYSDDTPQNSIPCGAAPLGVECASLGPDGEWGTKENHILKGSDDIVTWSHP